MPIVAFLLSPVGLRILMGIGIIIALAGAYHAVGEHFREQGRSEIQAKWDKSLEQAKEEQARIENEWQTKVTEANHATEQQRAADSEAFATLAQRYRLLANRPPVAISGAARGVWDDAARQANAAAAPASDHKTSVTVPKPAPADSGQADGGVVLLDATQLDEFIVNAARAYADAARSWQSCVSFYNSLREAK